MADTEVHLIGGLRVLVDGRELALPSSRKTRALLAWLVLEPGEHRRAALCELLWSETGDPRGGLRWSLTKLRGVLGSDALVTSTEAVALATWVRTDVADLETQLESARTADVALLAQLAERFGGAPLAGLDTGTGVEFELWVESQQDRLRRLQQRLLAALSERLPAAAALPYARQRVSLDPLSQAANEALLRLLRQVSGRREAQAALERMRDRFRDAGLSDAGLLAAWRGLDPGTGALPLLPAADAEAELAVPGKPSVAVLGFAWVEEADAILAEGLAVDLTYKLARLKGLFVTARASARRFDLAREGVATIGRRLGVRYLVHGTVQHLDKRLRVTVDLVECSGGEAVWAERFERALDDLFAVQDEMADAIVAALQPQIERAEQERARFLPTENLGAWECYHRAMWHSFRFTRADNAQAFALLERALREDPDFARAHAGLSFSYFSRVFLDASADVDGDLSRALDFAKRSISLQPRDALGHWSLGRALLLAREHDQALAAIDRALANNPNYAQGHYARGFIETHSGMADAAVSDLDMSRRLSPFDPLLFAMEASRAINLAVNGRHPEAAEWGVRATQEPNAHFHIFAIAAACLQLAARPAEARRQVARVLEMHPGYTVAVFERSFPHKSEHDRRIMADALAAAGLSAR